MKHKVILTKRFGESEVSKLNEEFDLIIVEDEGEKLLSVIEKNKNAEVLISFLSDTITKKVIDSLKDLKIIANYAVGYNNINFKYAGESGIYVTNTPEILTDATADLTMALILAVTRRIVESDRYIREGRFKGWSANLLLGRELRGLTLGIIGLGKIGSATAIRAMAFGMKIIYYSRTRKYDLEKKFGLGYRDLSSLLAESDIVSPHIPYTPDVHHMFNKDAFRKMKKDAIFINVSRGGLMDESALADVLSNGHLFGAGLDVFEYEPDVNKKLYKMDNVVMTPHTGSATFQARSGMGKMVIENIRQVLSGDNPENLIPELGHMVK